jgi:hypothetical protein
VTALRCANAAGGDCAAIEACFGGATETCVASACSDASHLTSCFAGVPFVVDCALESALCVEGAGEAAVAACGVEACGPEYVGRCEDTRLVTCVDGVASARSCPSGASCTDGACVGAGAPCPADSPPSCDGDTLVACVGGALAERDCRADAYQATCGPALDGVAACVAALDECEPASFVDRCNGARLEYCQDGRVEGVDCAALGFAACSVGDPAAGIRSRCAPPGGENADAGVPDATPPDLDAGVAP